MKQRRDFLKFITLGAIYINLKADEQNALYLRPPGALAERDFLSSCIKCGQCVQVCPYNSISLLDITHMFSIGTPVIDAKKRGCYLCDALPCVLACPSGALDHNVSEVKNVNMGVAVIKDINSCMAFSSTKLTLGDINLKKAKTQNEKELNNKLLNSVDKECDLCVKFCPYPQRDEAIIMGKKDGKKIPRIVQKCVGCGVCAELCPAKIIDIIPRASFELVYKGNL